MWMIAGVSVLNISAAAPLTYSVPVFVDLYLRRRSNGLPGLLPILIDATGILLEGEGGVAE